MSAARLAGNARRRPTPIFDLVGTVFCHPGHLVGFTGDLVNDVFEISYDSLVGLDLRLELGNQVDGTVGL